MKKKDNKRKKEKRNNEKEQLRKYGKKGEIVMRDNLDDEKKKHF